MVLCLASHLKLYSAQNSSYFAIHSTTYGPTDSTTYQTTLGDALGHTGVPVALGDSLGATCTTLEHNGIIVLGDVLGPKRDLDIASSDVLVTWSCTMLGITLVLVVSPNIFLAIQSTHGPKHGVTNWIWPFRRIFVGVLGVLGSLGDVLGDVPVLCATLATFRHTGNNALVDDLRPINNR